MNKDRTYPSTALRDAARAAGHTMRLLWDVPGPKGTGVAWLSCYSLGKGVVIVETFVEGGWDAFTPSGSIKVDETITDVFQRCGISQAEG